MSGRIDVDHDATAFPAPGIADRLGRLRGAGWGYLSSTHAGAVQAFGKAPLGFGALGADLVRVRFGPETTVKGLARAAEILAGTARGAA